MMMMMMTTILMGLQDVTGSHNPIGGTVSQFNAMRMIIAVKQPVLKGEMFSDELKYKKQKCTISDLIKNVGFILT